MKIVKNVFSVHKFGGSSLADAERFQSIRPLLSGQKEIIVVSATEGTTTALQALLELAKFAKDYQSMMQELQHKHQVIIDRIIKKDSVKLLTAELQADFDNIENILKSVTLIGDYAENLQAHILGFGELWSARILVAYLNQFSVATFLDASRILTVFHKHGKVQIDWQATRQALSKFLSENSVNQLVVTGFIARDVNGNRAILGRNGSDYSAAIFANLFAAKDLTIWTDVSGIYSADPRKVPWLSYHTITHRRKNGAVFI